MAPQNGNSNGQTPANALPVVPTQNPQSPNANPPSTANAPAVVATTPAVQNTNTNAQTPANTNAATNVQGAPAQNAQNSNVKTSSEISSGAAAGIGIGGALAGALVAFAVFWLLLAKRRKETPQRSSATVRGSHGDYSGHHEHKTQAIATIEIPEDTSTAIVYSNLPDSKDDQALSGEFSRLKHKIDGHVQTYYSMTGGNEQTSAAALTSEVGQRSNIPVSQLPALLSNSRSRPVVLKAAIAWIVFSRIMPGGDSARTFLPPNIASSYASLYENRMDDRTRAAFVSKWRVMTAALSSRMFGLDTLSADDVRLSSISAALKDMDAFLAPFSNDADREARFRNLEEIMKRAARLGWTLFSQASELTVDWSSSGGGIVVFPGLMQVTDEEGRLLRRARDLGGHKEVAAI